MLFTNELRFCFKQPLILLSFVLMSLFAFMLANGIDVGEEDVIYQLFFAQFALLMLALPTVMAALSPILLLRDSTSMMTELIHCMPISHRTRWLLRYSALAFIVFLLFIVSFFVIVLSSWLQLGFDVELIAVTLFNLVVLVLPAILISTAVALLISIRLQSTMVNYVVFALLGMGYMLLASLTGSPILAGSSVVSDNLYNASLIFDPLGISAVLDTIKLGDQPLSGLLIANRISYLLLAIVISYAALANNSFALDSPNTDKMTSKKRTKTTLVPVFGLLTQLLNFPLIQLVRMPLQALLHNRLTQLILVFWPILIGSEVLSGISFVEPMSILAPNSIDALNRVAFDVVPLLGSFVLALWSSYICSLNERSHVAELIATTPTSNMQLITAHILTMLIMVALLLIMTFIGSGIAEWIAGSEWQLGHYVTQLSVTGIPLFLLGVVFICIQHICRSRVTSGVVIFSILVVKFTPITTLFGLTHTLWNIAGAPIQEPDSFWGFSGSGSVFLPYISVWIVFCVALVVVATFASHRGIRIDRFSMSGLPKSAIALGAVSVLAFVSLHLVLIDEKPLTNSDKREAWKAQYEKSFGAWQDIPQPSVVHVDSIIDIYPEQQHARFNLSYTLENRTLAPIERVLIGRYGSVAGDASLELENATLVEQDDALRQRVFEFSTALQPGEQRKLRAEFEFEQPQTWPHASHQVVKPEFTYLRSVPLLPVVGFQKEFRLRDTQIRHDFALHDLEEQAPSQYFKDSETETGAYKWATYRSLVSTQHGHQVISQGELVRQWQEDQRSFFEFSTRTPMRAIPTWLSVPYSATSETINGTQLNVYSIRDNEAIEIHLSAMKDTLSWFNEHVSPYRPKQMSIVATPDSAATGYALPQIMLINDRIGFRAKPSPSAGFDQRYRRAVHEVAHQWFGHDMGNGVQEDRAFLIESMAKYIELVMIETHYGHDAMNALVEYERGRYARREVRNYAEMVGLVDATQTHDMYSRATLAFAELRAVVGDKVIIQALKSLWLSHQYPQSPATSMDFVRVLLFHAPAEHHALIKQQLLSTTVEY